MFITVSPPPITVAGPAQVIDGDTLRIGEERIGLFGIDAPEVRQSCGPVRCGVVARDWLVERIGGRPVTCVGSRRDRYRRLVARCIVGGEDLGHDRVVAGQAVAYRSYSLIYVDDEVSAQAAGRGLWVRPFDLPSDWRRRHRQH